METVHAGPNQTGRAHLAALAIILVLVLGSLVGCSGTNASSNVLSYQLSEPLNDITTAKFELDTGTGNLTIDGLGGGEEVLASGTLQYQENQGLPDRTMVTFMGQASLALKAGTSKLPVIRLPWAACNGETEWQIQLNPDVLSEITAHSAGGNVRFNLAGMSVTRVLAETGGGNMEVVLPERAANLSATVKTGAGDVFVEIGRGMTGSNTVNANSGAGNVVVRLADGIAARIRATSGMGKVTADSRFNKIDGSTYQSPDYDTAMDKVEVTLHSGAGNVSITGK